MTAEFIDIKDNYGSIKILNEAIDHIKKNRMNGFIIGIQGDIDQDFRDRYPGAACVDEKKFTQMYFCGTDSCLNLIGLCFRLQSDIVDYMKGRDG